MIRVHLIFSILACVLLPACSTTHSGAAYNRGSQRPGDPALSEELLLETLHYAFLWHEDQWFELTDPTGEDLEIFCRAVPRNLDEGDRSQFAELWIPEVDMVIELKRADYRIEELNLRVRDDQFKVRRVVRETTSPAPLSDYSRRLVAKARVQDWMAEHLRRAEPLPDVLAERLRNALLEFCAQQEHKDPAGHRFYVAPISPVSDELWVLHENTRQLLRFTSDMDLDDEAYWKTTPIHLNVFDLHPDVIQSWADIAAGTVKLRKNFVGRALFNCIVLGQQIELSDEPAKGVPDESTRPGHEGHPQ